MKLNFSHSEAPFQLNILPDMGSIEPEMSTQQSIHAQINRNQSELMSCSKLSQNKNVYMGPNLVLQCWPTSESAGWLFCSWTPPAACLQLRTSESPGCLSRIPGSVAPSSAEPVGTPPLSGSWTVRGAKPWTPKLWRNTDVGPLGSLQVSSLLFWGDCDLDIINLFCDFWLFFFIVVLTVDASR